MKIEGQNLRDVLLRLPWQYKIVVALSSAFILYVALYLPYNLVYLRLKPRPEASVPVVMAGILRPFGVLDPSIAADAGGQQTWMAFTAQGQDGYGNTGGGEPFDIRLADAKAGTRCKEWTVRATSFEARSDSIVAPDGQTILRTGAWRIETPGLVYDPDDPGKEWKLFAYKYFWSNDQKDIMSVARHYGAIVYKYASDPAGEWSPEQWLFSPADNYPPPPYQGTVLLHLNQLDPSLQNVTAYARPSAVYKDGMLVMTLSAFTNDVVPDRVIMIASADHGRSWHFVATVLQQSDVAAIDATSRLAGAALLQQDGRVYLAAVLGNAQQRGIGTFVFGFDDFFKGHLQRDMAGAPAILNQVPLQGPRAGVLGGGTAAYSDACKSGMLLTAQNGNKGEFTIYRTRFKPIDNSKQGEK